MSKLVPFVVLVAGAGSVWAQSVISAHSGVIHYVEGQATVDDKTVQPKFAQFPDVTPGQTFATQDGRAEVLLTPGVFLRTAENTSFRMISNKLADTRVEILSGSALVEVAEMLPGNAISLQFHDSQIALLKKGLYRLDVDSSDANFAQLRVYDGDARVTFGARTLTAGRGHEVDFGVSPEVVSFDPKATDAFYRWGARRSEYIADANVASAKSAQDSGLGYGASGYAQSGWAWNPWMGMFTYLPANGIYFSPFGPAFYSPAAFGYLSSVGAPVLAPYRGGFSGTGNTAAFTPRSAGSVGNSSFRGGAGSMPRTSGGFGGLRGGGAGLSGGGGGARSVGAGRGR